MNKTSITVAAARRQRGRAVRVQRAVGAGAAAQPAVRVGARRVLALQRHVRRRYLKIYKKITMIPSKIENTESGTRFFLNY